VVDRANVSKIQECEKYMTIEIPGLVVGIDEPRVGGALSV
jgi:hypothetical protein